MRPATNRAAFALFALAIAAVPRGALGQDDPVCAKYREPLAYNACLASHGPRATALGASSEHAQPQHEDDPSTSTVRARSPYAARHQGRVHMEFRLH